MANSRLPYEPYSPARPPHLDGRATNSPWATSQPASTAAVPLHPLDGVQAGINAGQSHWTFRDGAELALAYEIGVYLGNETHRWIRTNGVKGAARIVVRRVRNFVLIASALYGALLLLAQLPFFSQMGH